MHKIQRIVVILVTLFMVTASRAGKLLPIVVTGNGTVTASKSNGDPIAANSDVDGGTTVKLTVAPGSGSYLYKLIAKEYAPGPSAGAPSHRADGPTVNSEIPMTKISATLYQFIMPTYDVEVTAEFVTGTSIADATINLNEGSHVYDWIEHSPTVTSVTLGSITLTEGTDYTVDVFAPVKNVGNYNVTVRGKGKYYGSATQTYSITARSLAGTTDYLAANVQLPQTSFVYNHSEQKPVLTSVVVYNNGQELVLDRDYENVRYETSTSQDVGSYRVLVTGKGNFKDDASASYTITKMPISNCTINGTTSFVFNNSVQAPTVNATEGTSTGIIITDGVDQLATTDYTVTYNNEGTTWNATASSKEIGTYHMRLTATNPSNYSGYVDIPYYITSAGATITAVGGTIYTGENIYATAYTGQEITPTITVMDGSATLTKDTHYTVQYYNNVNAGLATVTAVGKGVYNFNVSKNFRINPKALTEGMVSLSATSFTYNANVQKPTVTVSDGTAMKSSDYVITNEGGTNVGNTYEVEVEGQNNYTGTITKTFSITALSLDGASITLGTTNYVYDGTAKTPTVQQVKVGSIIIPSTDYTVGYDNNVNANTTTSTPTVTINPKTSNPNLSGSASTTFTIGPKPVSDLTITLSATSFTYDGTVQKPTVTVEDGSTTLTSGTHYDLTWAGGDSKAVGSYTVTITGKGNYTGSVVKTYVINYGTSDTDFHIALTTPFETFTYDGTAKEPAVTVTKGTGEGAVTLTKNTDYTLEYSNNINAGLATITARGIKNYQFITTFNFTINKKEITSGMVTLSGINYDATNNRFVYNGALQKPVITIMHGSTKTLVEGTDYTLVNDGGTNVGNYTATITGIGNYSTAGTSGLSMPYSIVQLSLTEASVTLDPQQNYVYDGTEKRPGVQQVKVGNVIVPTTDYDVTYPRDNTSTPSSTLNVNAGTNTAQVYINPKTSGTINLSGSKTQTFSITKKPLSSEMITLTSEATNWANNSFTYTGTTQKPDVTVTDGTIMATSDYTVTNEGGIAVGIYYVTVTATATGNYSGTIKVPYSIVSDNADNDVTITLGASDPLVYTGNPITRTITVTKGTNTTPLTAGTDYDVVYSNNTNVGEATITVMGRGNYHFVKYAYFNITERAMTTGNGIDITLSPTSFEYNGSTQKPNVTVKYTKPSASTATTLVEGTDYTLNNPGAVNVGTDYKATITGIGNFTGTMDSPTYEITAKDLTDAVITLYPLANPVYDGTVKEPTVQKVTVGEQVYTSGYTVSFSYNVNVKTTEGTVDHYPTVTITSDDTGNFSGSASTTFVIQPKPLADDMVTLNTTSYTYDGTAKEPTATVTDTALPSTFTSKVLTQDKDYTITWTSGHTLPGEYVATIQGKGNYTGSVTKPYVIHAIDGNDDVTITLTDEPEGGYEYDGNEKKPTVQVKKGSPGSEVILTPSTATVAGDYTVAYSDNKNAGTATITVTGKGNYDFTQTKTFSIAQKAMTNEMVTLSGIPVETDGTYFTYDGTLKKPVVTVSDDTPSIITADDYTISNEGNINAGDYTVTVTASATGNYSGSGSQTYTIRPMSITTAEVALSYNNIVYNGVAQKPTVRSVYANGHLLTATTDYTITLPADADAINQGAKNVTVTGTGNYKDSRTVQYTIDKKPLVSDMIKIANQNLTYTGSDQTPSVTIEDKNGTTDIIKDADYTLSNPAHSAVGNYEVTLTATDEGNYSGQVTKQYSIVTAGSTGFTVVDIPDQNYTGIALTPALTVYKAGTTTPALELDTDYTAEYSNNINAGTATVTVTGIGNYSGTQTKTFTIVKRSLINDDITTTLTPSSFTYDGTPKKPTTVIVHDALATINKDLKLGEDYTLEYKNTETTDVDNLTSQGIKKVVITGIGNYSGTLEPTYTVGVKSVAGAEVSLSYTTIVYNGATQKPTVTSVIVDGHQLTENTDYTVDFTDISDYKNQGNKTFHITGIGNYSGTKSLNYTIQKKAMTSNMITFNQDSFDYDGSNHAPTVTMVDLVGSTNIVNTDQTQDFTINIPTVSAVGSYTVNVEATTTGNYSGGGSKQFSIVPKGSVAFDVAWVTEPNFTYDGTAHTPAVKVTKHNTTTELTAADYDIEYNNNINAGTNTASVTVTGKGNYSGSQTKTFSIAKRSLSGTTDITATLTPSSFTYNGNPQQPATIIVHDALTTISKDLTYSKDYTVTYPADMITQGTKTVTITGEGNYTGTLSPTYTINQLDISPASITLFSLPSYVYDGSNKEPGVQLVKVGNFVVPMEAYDVSYTNHKDASTATNKARVTVTAKDGSNFTGSAYTEFTILQKEVNSNMMTLGGDGFNTTTNSFTYDGAAHVPTVAVSDKVGGVEIITTNDYTLTNAGGTNVGNYEVKIDGKGNYTGSAVKQYSIVTKGATGFTVGAIAAQDYTGMALTPKPTVTATVNGVVTTLTENTHYTLAWANNVNAGTNTASVTVTGIGDYSGTQTVYFTINPKALAMTMLTLSATSFTYNGNEQKPTVTVKDGGTTLSVDKDYTVTWPADMVSQGTKTITITGIGNYSGTLEPTYSVGLKSVAGAEVTLSYESIVFNGSVQKPTVTSVIVDGHKLTAGTDYTTEFTSTADYTNQGGKSFKIKGTGNYADEKELSYTIEQKAVTSSMIVLANENLIYTGLDQHPTVTIQDMVGTTNIITSDDYTLLNPDHATVGTYVVTLTGKGNYKGTAEKQYSIIGNQAAGFTVAAIGTQEYTGAEIKPEPSVTDNNSRALTKGTDYTVEYSNNINAGTATVTVTGINGYSGTKSVNFEITPKSLNHVDIGVTLSPATFTYTGTTQKPTVTVKDGTSKTLAENTDYTLVNDGGIANGTYTVTITGMGNYKDVVTPAPSYTIGGQSLNGAEVILNRLDSYVYDGNEKKPGVSEVKVGSTVIPASNYTVSYADNVNAGTATVTVTGKGNCSGTATATFPITPKTVNSDMITISPTTFNYDGQLHKPSTVTVKDGTRDMVEDTDYTLSNPGGTDIGSYGVTITGKGNYTGTASKSFSIVANDASGFSINAIADVTYNGAAQEPVPVVKEGDNTLNSNYYSVAYLNNINAGTAVVTVTGKNGYSFVKSQTFKIKPKALNNDMLTLSASSFMYNGNVQKPTPTMDDKNAGVSIITSNDYVVTNEGGVDVGTYHVVITGQNNYTGAIDKTFTITQLSLSTATITLATLSSYVYDGLAKTPAVQLVKVGELVVPATAYDVAYSSNTNVGTATVTVTAKTGTNFKDGNTTTFSIEQKPVTSDMIYLSSENLEYTGSTIKPEVTVKDGTKTLALTTDYTLTNAGGTEVGSYEVMITGQGNYKGTAKKQYSIITKGAAGFTVDELTVPLTYTGMPQTPMVTVKKAGTTTVLTLGTDYEVAYTDNINVGTATATVTGKGNYSGTRSVNFTINPKPLTDGMVALSSTSFIYSGSEQKPVVSVTDTDNNMPLTQNTDYTVTYPTDAISQGTKTVTIRGIGNYTGEITKDYTIGQLSLDDASVTLNELTSYIYDGNEKKPTVKEVKVGTLVIPTTGYTVAYPDDVINTGTKTMTITGKGNYTGATTASYTITPKTVTKEMILLSSENLIYTGSIIKPTVTVKDGSKTLIENTDYTLTNEGGKEVGTYSLTITGKGNYTGTASRTFNIITKGASVFSVSDIASVIYNGSEQEPDITVMDNSTTPATVLTKGTHYTVAYSNNKNVGSASVIVTGIGSYAGTVSKNFTILPKTLTGAMVTLSATSFVFNSLAQKPEVTVDDKNAANVSIITDYDYTILNNGGINVGDNHEVKVTGKGNYTGTVTKTYAITPLSIADANVTLYQLQSYVYDGTAKKPGVREVMVDDITVPTTGYDVSYGENTNVGTATVTLTGKGNFKDAKTVNFTITGKPITSDMIVLSSENFIYNGEVQKPTVIVKDGAKTLTLGTDYALTNAGGTSVGTYSVTVAGMGNYASEASRSYSIVEKDGTTNFTISLSNTSVQYNGSAQTPAVTVTDGVKTLTNNTDYEVAYTNHVNVGTATVTVTGKGNYAGTKTATFTITAKPLTEAMVTLSETSFVYNTLIQKPEVSVSDGDIMTKDDYVITNNGGTNQGTYHVIVNGQGNYSGQIDKTFTITPLSIAEANVTLYQLQSYVYEGLQKKPGVREVTVGNINVPTQGYTTSYGDNVNAGTASVTVTGQGNFKDSKTVTFEIEPKAVENSMITLSNYEYTYNGEIQKPEVIVRDGETTLLLDTDYTLLNNGGKTVGSYDVTITGKGNYKGTASKTYVINTKEVGSFEVTLSAESVTYNGSEQQPEVTVKDGETVLTSGVHYTVTYTDNVNVGMATVTVRGQGEYEGSRSKTFLIQPKSLSEAMVSLNTTTFTYNGLLQMPAVTVSDGTALTSNDYYITNEGGLDKGTYNVMVTGRNNYTGTVIRQYVINPMSINDGHVTLYQLQSYVYDGTAKNPGVREVAVGSHIIPSTSFNTTISPNINVGTVTVTVTGEKNYTGSTSTTFEITPKPVTSGMITLTPDYFYYNGSVQKPGVTVKDGEKNMVENTDYTVTNNGGTEAGEYEVKVKGIGNYTSEATQSFTILSSGVNTFVVTLETNEYTFDGTAHKPGVTVKMDDRTLTEGTDYTLTYSNNINAGTATVTVKGVGDYTGEQVKTFLIQPKTLTDEMVTLNKTSFIFNDKVQKPEVTVADGTIMTEDDYIVTNEGGTTEGTYQVVVTGQNNYKGVVIKSFTIIREDIHADDDPEHPDEKPITYTPTEEGSDEVKVSGFEGTTSELEQITSVTIPATCTSNGKTYAVVGIASDAFANIPNVTDIYMPDTEEPLEIAEDAIPASATVHTTLALLDNYALMPSLSESFKAGKIMTTVTAKNRYWTFSSGVDVYVPDGVSVYIARERSSATVTIVELSDNDLTMGGQRIIKHNNGVLISSEGNDTPYDLVACGRRMSSGSMISTDDFKDYGSQNCLVPVIVPTHFDAGYYFLKNNEFYSIQEEGEDVKVPAGKAVLYLQQAASSPSYSSIIQLINTGEVTNINGIENDTDEGDWYDMSGRKLDRRPTKKGVYIKNNKKIVIR